MQEVLDMGLHMCIYPEGTRNTSSEAISLSMTVHSGLP
ncbi:MAG: hypothetical protein WDM78_06130 [Puia sp.]